MLTPELSIDIRNIVVRKATTSMDHEKALSIRWAGYGKYFTDRAKINDRFDAQKNCTLLLATDARNDNPIGTLRILDRQTGSIELDQFLDVGSLIYAEGHPNAEATRFSVPATPSAHIIKLALWKAFWLYCCSHGIRTMLIWTRQSAARDYKRLLFSSVGSPGVFVHPLLGDIEHHTYIMDIESAIRCYEDTSHPLYTFFVLDVHPKIQFS